VTALRRDMITAVETELRKAGVTWTRDDKSRHLKYTITVGDQTRLFTCAATPSDRRAHLNALTDLRRVLGIKRVVHKNPENRKKKAPTKLVSAAKMPTVTVRPDPMQALAALRAEPHWKPLGHATMDIDAAARSLAAAILA